MPEPLRHLEYEVMMVDGYFVIEDTSLVDHIMPDFNSDQWLLATENQVTISRTSQGLGPWDVRLEFWDSEPVASATPSSTTSESLAYFATGTLVAWQAWGESDAGEFDLAGKGVYRVRASASDDERYLVQFWPGTATDTRDDVPAPGKMINPMLLSLNIPDEVKSALISRSLDSEGIPCTLTEQDIREAYEAQRGQEHETAEATQPPEDEPPASQGP
ncbi:hypothetical protein [Amycolatopsis circi]|uniref:hypothetical protein n=1 Tax=Amycolatopsis circi TaxID=871959 RepID=UPI0013BE983D|nr:hypothetical protein [Amycolatopsis circi]